MDNSVLDLVGWLIMCGIVVVGDGIVLVGGILFGCSGLVSGGDGCVWLCGGIY